MASPLPPEVAALVEAAREQTRRWRAYGQAKPDAGESYDAWLAACAGGECAVLALDAASPPPAPPSLWCCQVCGAIDGGVSPPATCACGHLAWVKMARAVPSPPAPQSCVVCQQPCDGKWTHICRRCAGEPPAPVEDDGLDARVAYLDRQSAIGLSSAEAATHCWLRELQACRRKP